MGFDLALAMFVLLPASSVMHFVQLPGYSFEKLNISKTNMFTWVLKVHVSFSQATIHNVMLNLMSVNFYILYGVMLLVAARAKIN